MEFQNATLIPIILGITELIKKIGLPSQYAPLFSLGLGIGLTYILGTTGPQMIINGLILGLSASGLYSTGKTGAEKLGWRAK